MKQKQKKIYYLVLFGMIFTLFNCQKDDINQNSQTQKSNVIFKKTSVNEMAKSNNEVDRKIIQSINSLNTNRKLKSNRNDDSNFIIDRNKGSYIQTVGSRSYTFPVYRDDGDEKLENILFSYYNDGTLDISLLKYNFSSDELQTVTDERLKLPIGQSFIQKEHNNSITQRYDCSINLLICNNDGHGNYNFQYHIAGSGCTNQQFLSTMTINLSCGAGSSDGANLPTLPAIPIDTSSNPDASGATYPIYGFTKEQRQFWVSLDFATQEYFAYLDVNTQINIFNFVKNNPTITNAVKLFLNSTNFSWISEQYLETQSSIFNYLIANNFNSQSREFANQFISNSVVNPNLQIDFNLSTKSPAFIDMSSVNGNTPEEIKFREAYNNLTQSPLFKQLFTNMFGTTPLFDVKFAVVDIPQTGSGYVSGKCKLFNSPNNLAPYNIIEIDRNYLLSNNNINIAQTILHECIHAYLNIKLRNSNIGLSISNINNLDIQACINTYYNGFSGNQTQHDFFINYMIPTMVNIFTDIKDQLLTPVEIHTVEYPVSNVFIYATTPTIPSTKIYSQVLPWSWNNFFTHVSYSGLQNCSEYSSIYPTGSSNELNLTQYFQIAIFTFLP